MTHDLTLKGIGTAAVPLGIADAGVGFSQLANGAVGRDKIASGQVVKSINSIADDVTLIAGSGIAISSAGSGVTIAATGLLSSVSHNGTLAGSGTATIPLGINVPLSLSGVTSGTNAIVEVTSTGNGYAISGSGGIGVRGTGGIAIFGEVAGDDEFAGVFHGTVHASELLVFGEKDFVEPHPTDPSKMISYVCLEGREAGTYFRGSGRIVNGSAVIEVPEDFRIVSDEKGLTVQVTPMGGAASIWCVGKSLDKIELKASADVEFDYMVNGVRTMLKDRNPIVENTFFVPANPNDNLSWIRRPEAVRRLKASGILNEDGSPNLETVKKLEAYKRVQNRPQ